MARIREVTLEFPYWDDENSRIYDYFEDYFNDKFSSEWELINVQLIEKSGEDKYLFWIK
jgi:hypothetical protein